MFPRSTQTPAGSSEPSASQGIGTPASRRIRSQREALSNSQYGPVAVKAYIDLLPKASSGNAFGPVGKSILDADEAEPTPAPLPGDHPDATIRSPDNPFRTLRQVRLYNAFKASGPAGVAHFLYEECQAEKAAGVHKSSTWDIIIQDGNNGNQYVTLLLSMLPEVVIESLIKGTLNYDMRQNQKVRHYVNVYMGSSGYPGIYLYTIVYPAVSIFAPGVSVNGGRWLSTNQISSLLDKYTAYIEDTDQVTNDAVDAMFGGYVERKWADNDRKRSTGKAWIAEIRRQYCQNMDPTALDTPHVSTPFEIGWSKCVQTRIPRHAENSSTTYIFGFNNAITRLSGNKGGFDFTSPPFSAALFPVWKKDKDLANVAEILGSLLTGSYWYHGGYNCTYAGTFNVTLDEDDIGWDRAKSNAQDRLRYCQAPDLLVSHAVDLEENIETYRRRHQDREELDALKEELRKGKDGLRTSEAKLESWAHELRHGFQRREAAAKDHYAALDARSTPGERGEPMGTWMSHVSKLTESSNRVKEEFDRRARIPYAKLKPLAYRPGPLAVVQPLTEEEQAKVEVADKRLASCIPEAIKRIMAQRDAKKKASEVPTAAASQEEGSSQQQVSPSRTEPLEESPEL
ncbi:MAG: hypothetical protein Q9196_006890 [Gyalolechia fulgens]